jgi:hypothetical protein
MRVWGVVLVGMDGSGTRHIAIVRNKQSFFATTIKRVKQLVMESSGRVAGDAEEIRLIFAGKQLETSRGSR